MTFDQSTERELDAMEQKIARIDRTAKAKAKTGAGAVNKSVTFKEANEASKEAISRASRASSKKASPRTSQNPLTQSQINKNKEDLISGVVDKLYQLDSI
jgi:hypothetical protein